MTRLYVGQPIRVLLCHRYAQLNVDDCDPAPRTEYPAHLGERKSSRKSCFVSLYVTTDFPLSKHKRRRARLTHYSKIQ